LYPEKLTPKFIAWKFRKLPKVLSVPGIVIR